MRKNLLLLLLMVFSLQMIAQTKKISGRVTDSKDNMPLPGVTVQNLTSKKGTITDMDGKFVLEAAQNEQLRFTFIGYESQNITVGSSDEVNVNLNVETKGLEEVVVVGYGTQKKSVVTGSISSVKGKDLDNLPVAGVAQAMQGKASGVTIASNSGQPGGTATVRVRGVTTFNGNDPLWVVDGIIVDNGGINYLNQSDIESIEVLKDASSLAIYGARAASGVILVSTKKGAKGKINVSYNGYTGLSAPARKLNLLNATQYATIMNEKSIANGGDPIFANPSSLGAGTDWQSTVFNNKAKRSSHELSVSGGNDVSTFYLSVGLQDQDGIVATDISNYNKINFRLNSTHKLFKNITVGQTLGYSREKTVGIGTQNSEFGGVLSSAINLDPTTPLVITDPTVSGANPYSTNAVVRDGAGNPYGISNYVGQEMSNPLAYIKTQLGNTSKADNFVGNAFVEIAPIEGLKIKSTVGAKLAFWGGENFTPKFYLNASNLTSQNSLYRSNNEGLGYNIENTISYTKAFDKNNFEILVGQGAYVDGITKASGVTYFDLPVTTYDQASFNFGATTAKKDSWANEGVQHKVTSLFSRLNYNFDGKYLFTGIVRQDGSSRFGTNNKYGYFPSFSAGWVTSKEKFWIENKVITQLKIRGGYGITGNDAIGDFAYLSTIGSGRNYTIGGVVQSGFSPNAPENPDLKWETTTQSNIGFEAMFMNDISLTVDYYNKKTSGILQDVALPGYVGATGSPKGNVADMTNKGLEIELGYRKKIGDLNFSINTNFSLLKNNVDYVGLNKTFIDGAASFQSMGTVTIIKQGLPFNSFYGYEYDGVFQNAAQVAAYKDAKGNQILPNAKPGDLIWKDLNGDGKIDGNDRTDLGSSLPKYTFGFTLNADYKGFDAMVFIQGAGGNKIFQGLRRLDIQNANYQNNILSRWTGEGSTNTYPRLTNNDANLNYSRMSNLYLEKGDYIRFKVIQLGYSLPSSLISKIGASKVRLYVSGENLITLTKYTGYDPEIGGSVFGIDKGYYPQAKTFMFGLNLQF